MGLITQEKDEKLAAEEAAAEETDNETESSGLTPEEEAAATKQSEKESLGKPLLLEGTRVKVSDANGVTRMAVVIDHVFDSIEDQIQFHLPAHPYRMFAKVKSYIVRTRDARNEVLEIPADEVQTLDTTEGWGRGES